MKRYGPVGWVTWILLILGGLNWGLVGINSKYDVVAMLLGSETTAARGVYILVGVAALLAIYFKCKCRMHPCCKNKDCCNNKK
jgi:uncharacterized membrane protein YuzA (DUF378 family)